MFVVAVELGMVYVVISLSCVIVMVVLAVAVEVVSCVTDWCVLCIRVVGCVVVVSVVVLVWGGAECVSLLGCK